MQARLLVRSEHYTEDGGWVCCWPAGTERHLQAEVLALLLCHPQAPGKYTVVMGDEKEGPDTLAMRSGDMVEVVEEGAEGLW